LPNAFHLSACFGFLQGGDHVLADFPSHRAADKSPQNDEESIGPKNCRREQRIDGWVARKVYAVTAK
jgi:hypothetical protein